MANENEGSQGKKKKSSLTLIIIILLLLVLSAGGVFFYLMMSSSKTAQQNSTDTQQPADSGDMGMNNGNNNMASSDMGVNYDLPQFTVNLVDPSGVRYLKIGISMSLPSKNKELSSEIDNRLPKIKDTIITILSSKTFEEITTPQGKIALRQEILRRINSILVKGKVMEIYLTEFVVQ